MSSYLLVSASHRFLMGADPFVLVFFALAVRVTYFCVARNK